MSDPGEKAPLIVGVCLINDIDHTHSHTLTAITLPPSHLALPLPNLRPLIKTSLLPSLSNRSFSFISSHDWEINVAMETTATIEQVKQVSVPLMSHSKIQRSHVEKFSYILQVFQTKHTQFASYSLAHSLVLVWLPMERRPSVPLGFICCATDLPLTQLMNKLQEQLPELHATLVAMGYSIFDNNGWPIGQSQEAMFSLAEVTLSTARYL